MKFVLKVYVWDDEKAIPFFSIKREEEKQPTPNKILLKWKSWTFQSENNYGVNINEIPTFSLEVSDNNLFSTFKDVCKDISTQMDCLVYGESHSSQGQLGCGFYGYYEKGNYIGFFAFRDEHKKAKDLLHNNQFYLRLQIESIGKDD